MIISCSSNFLVALIVLFLGVFVSSGDSNKELRREGLEAPGPTPPGNEEGGAAGAENLF